MLTLPRILLSWIFILLTFSSQAQFGRQHINLDEHWSFFRGGVLGAENPSFDDAAWRVLNLPHDWSIENLPGTQSPFDKNAISQVGGGYSTGGTGWYRKKLLIAKSDSGKVIQIVFDGIYMNADVWINGTHLGNHPYGYTSFWYDISKYLRYGNENTIAVEVKNEGQNSRWYSGSGIYRHVWLNYVQPLHITNWGTFVSCTDSINNTAQVRIQSQVENSAANAPEYTLQYTIMDNKGKTVSSAISSIHNETGLIFQTMSLQRPIHWSVDSPFLYTLKTTILQNNRIVDETLTRFGIRSIRYSAARGLELNGTSIKLKGGCIHEDHGPLGASSYDRAEERRILLMKASGFNAIRCAHNPPSPALLDFCDSLGMLVIDEAFDMWTEGKNPYDYHLYFRDWWARDVESMVYRDRNHPSVIIWSIGNEIPDIDSSAVVQVGKNIAMLIRKLDPDRPITSAINGVKDENDPFTGILDIVGYNYSPGHYVPDHQKKPDRIMMGTESYALEAFDYWMQVNDHPYVIGDFVWTGVDYIGEASIGWRGYMQENNFYPWNLAYCGDIDICGWKRPQSYYRDVLWKPDQLSIFVKPPTPSFPLNPHIESWSKWNWEDVVADWNWEDYINKPLEVKVYSSCEEVELFLNGHSLGKQTTNRSSRFTASWMVPYAKGRLEAIGYSKHKQVAKQVLNTAGNPSEIHMTADRSDLLADGNDLSYVTVEIRDEKNITTPKDSSLLHFSVTGPGEIIGVGNANPMSTESFQGSERKAWRGKCLVIIKSKKQQGEIVLTATTAGLPSGKTSIRTK